MTERERQLYCALSDLWDITPAYTPPSFYEECCLCTGCENVRHILRVRHEAERLVNTTEKDFLHELPGPGSLSLLPPPPGPPEQEWGL